MTTPEFARQVRDHDPAKPDGDLAKKLIAACASRGVMIISSGVNSNVIRILSPLIISRAVLLKGLTVVREELEKLTKPVAVKKRVAA